MRTHWDVTVGNVTRHEVLPSRNVCVQNDLLERSWDRKTSKKHIRVIIIIRKQLFNVSSIESNWTWLPTKRLLRRMTRPDQIIISQNNFLHSRSTTTLRRSNLAIKKNMVMTIPMIECIAAWLRCLGSLKFKGKCVNLTCRIFCKSNELQLQPKSRALYWMLSVRIFSEALKKKNTNLRRDYTFCDIFTPRDEDSRRRVKRYGRIVCLICKILLHLAKFKLQSFYAFVLTLLMGLEGGTKWH